MPHTREETDANDQRLDERARSPHASGRRRRALLTPQARPAEVPASFAQQRIWFLDRLAGGRTTEFNMVGAWRLRGPLDLEALTRALRTIVARHETLRTLFMDVDGTPMQVVSAADDITVTVAVEDAGVTPIDARATLVQAALQREQEEPLDLEHGPIVRLRVLRLADDDHLLLRTLHHIAWDGWSEGILNRELATLYAAYRRGEPDPLPPLSIQYIDFALHQRARLDGLALDDGLAYWRTQLAGVPASLDLPTDRPRAVDQSFAADVCQVPIPGDTIVRVRDLARTHRATLFMVLVGAFGALLARYSGDDDLVVGTPIANRDDAALEQVVGLFINTLALRIRCRPDDSFASLIDAVRRTTLDAYAYQDVPFERLVALVAPRRSAHTSPLFQVMFSLDNMPGVSLVLPDLEATAIGLVNDQLRFDLKVSVRVQGTDAVLSWRYNHGLFDRARMQRMAQGFVAMLETFAADPATPLGAAPLLNAAERQQILETWNATTQALPAAATVRSLIEAQVARTPDAVAVWADDQALTYAELDARAARLARVVRAHGVGAESVVGVLVDRTPAFPIALLAIWKAGATYLPLSTQHPAARLAQVIAQARVEFVISESAWRDRWPAAVAIVAVDEHQDPTDLTPPSRPLDLATAAYVLHTSGSTGEPKGVVVSHGALLNTVMHGVSAWALRPGDVVAALASNTVDFSLLELLAPLVAGATARLVAVFDVLDPATLAARLGAVTHLHAVPRVMALLLETVTPRDVPALRRLSTGGDVVPPQVRRDMARLQPEIAVEVNYGPTEAGIICADATIAGDRLEHSHPMGRPLPNMQAYVLDTRLEPVPCGVVGDLYVSGLGLARGYLRQARVTAERFVASPFGAPGARLYRTGDRVTWRDDGTLAFVGRADRQTKIYGFRVEPGEVEAALRLQPEVRDAAVVTRLDDEGQPQLAAYVVAAVGASLRPDAVRHTLSQHLPSHMVPATVQVLDRLPLTAGGKLEPRALPPPSPMREGHARSGQSARTPEQAVLCELFADALHVSDVGIHDDFFALGGHSLLATRLLSRIRATLRVDLSMAALFDAPSVVALEPLVRKGAGSILPLTRQPRPAIVPASAAQRRLWFIDTLAGGGNTTYNVTSALRLRGELDHAALQRALDTIVARHEILRTHFAEIDGAPVQIIEPALSSELPIEEIAGHESEKPGWAAVQAIIDRERQRPFDLMRGPLFRYRLVRRGPLDHVLVRTIHHVASDGWSASIFARELATLYEAYRAGAPDPLPPLPVQYADFALWEREWLASAVAAESLEYWARQLADMPSSLQIPTDRPRPQTPTRDADTCTIVVSADDLAALKRLSRAGQATLYMTLVAGLDVLFAHYSGHDDVVIGSPTANRQDAQLESVIGFFTNTLVLRVQVDQDQPFETLLRRVRAMMLDAYAHQHMPFDRLVEAIAPPRHANAHPLCQVLFELMNVPEVTPRLGALDLERLNTDTHFVGFDLELHAREQNGTLVVVWGYSTDLFDAWRVEQMARHYHRLLQAIVATPQQTAGNLAVLATADELVLEG